MVNICVSSQFLCEVFRSCQDLGARKPVLLSALNLTDAHLRDPRKKFSADTITALCQATAQELESENVFLDVGKGITPTGFSDIGYAAMFEETVGGVLQAAAAAMDFGFNKPLLRWEQSASASRLIVDPDSGAANDLIFIIFSSLLQFGNIVTNSGPQPIKTALFMSRQPRNCDGAITLPDDPEKVPCLFDQPRTSLELHRDVINLPNPFANREVVRAAQLQSNRYQDDGNKSGPLSRLSYNYLFHLLDRSGLSIDAAAETFGVAERTLRRKLAAEDTSFRQILEQVRRDTCQLYFLEGIRSLSEIATKLGYSELSAFTRAYTGWYGRSPSRDMAAEIAIAA